MADSVLRHGVADVLRTTDGGWFGAGAYLTPQAEYAAMYSSGTIEGKVPAPDSQHVMLLCAVVVANSYPVTRGTDYVRNAENTQDISVFHCAYPARTKADLSKRRDKALMQGFDSHFVAVTVDNGYQVRLRLHRLGREIYSL